MFDMHDLHLQSVVELRVGLDDCVANIGVHVGSVVFVARNQIRFATKTKPRVTVMEGKEYYDIGSPAEMYEDPASAFSANPASEREAIGNLRDLLEDEGEEQKVTYEELILSLGGSKRTRDERSENTALTLVEKVRGRRPQFQDTTPLLVISGEDIHVPSEGLGEIGVDIIRLHVRVPMKREIVIPPPFMVAERDAAIAGHSVNSIAELGRETAESPFIMQLTEVLKRCKLIHVHNDLWLHGSPFACDNLFFDRTPCILYALKQAVSAGATVRFVDISDWRNARICRTHFQYVREGDDVGKSFVTWTRDKDVRFEDNPNFTAKYRKKKGGKRTRRSTRRLRRKTKSTRQYK